MSQNFWYSRQLYKGMLSIQTLSKLGSEPVASLGLNLIVLAIIKYLENISLFYASAHHRFFYAVLKFLKTK
jgi:hypothetical protein